MTQITVDDITGIRFDSMVVRELSFRDTDGAPEGPAEGLALTRDVTVDLTDDMQRCRTTLSLSLGSLASQFEVLKAAVEGVFSLERSDGTADLKEFGRQQAPAILMPFVRTEIASLTARTRLGQVLLPPINVAAVLEQMAAGN